jgi:HD-GYP domain-containing protein (c-di-GMP phosphodiesterase class II)
MMHSSYKSLIGKKLSENIMSAKGVLLIPANTVLLEGHIAQLEQFHISEYDIHVDDTEEEAASGEEHFAESREVKLGAEKAADGIGVNETGAKLQSMETVILKTGKIPLAEVEEEILPAMIEMTKNRNIYNLFAELRDGGNEDFKHSIRVSYIAAMIGRWLQLDEPELALLVTGVSFCDIGLLKLPSELQEKRTTLMPHEHEIRKQHTVLGYELLKESGMDHRAALVALQHHEREDGSGYPTGLRGTQIDQFSKIAALADAYVDMTTDRPEHPRLPFYQVIEALHQDVLRGRFDFFIGLTFLNRLMSSQIGSDVILSDERRGKILLVNANYPSCPVITINGEVVDLSKTKELKIAEVIG